MKLVVLAGLPGTGKSTLARELATRCGARILDKDRRRAERFGAAVRYTREQDDGVVRELLDEARELARGAPAAPAILDGRCWTRGEDVEELRRFARESGLELCWVECRAERATAHARLCRDTELGLHPAANRGVELYQRLEAERSCVLEDALVLDTTRASPAELAEQVVQRWKLAPAR